MTNSYAICSGSRVRMFVSSPDRGTADANAQAGEIVVETSFQSDPSAFIFDGSNVVSLPPKPNEYCVFNYDTLQWVDQRTPEMQWGIVRADRNKRLQACDWTQLSDIPADTKALWEPYRQALRDVANQSDPFNIVWPTPPQ